MRNPFQEGVCFHRECQWGQWWRADLLWQGPLSVLVTGDSPVFRDEGMCCGKPLAMGDVEDAGDKLLSLITTGES